MAETRRDVLASAAGLAAVLSGCATQAEVNQAMNETELENLTKLSIGNDRPITNMYRVEDPETGAYIYIESSGSLSVPRSISVVEGTVSNQE